MPEHKTVVAAIGELLVPPGRGSGPATSVPVDSPLTAYVEDVWNVEPEVAAAAAWLLLQRVVETGDAAGEQPTGLILAARLLLGLGDLPRTGADEVIGTELTFYAACERAGVEPAEPDFLQSTHRQVLAAATSSHYKSKSAWNRGKRGLVSTGEALLDRINARLRDLENKSEVLVEARAQLTKSADESRDSGPGHDSKFLVPIARVAESDDSGGVSVPRTLPPARATFVNRTAELAAVTEQACGPRDRASVVVLAGSQGMGKSSLAERWAHQNQHLFRDGQLYLRMGASPDREAVSLDDVMGIALQSMGCKPSHLPESVDARSAMYRTLTANRELLVILDQVPAPALVRPFIPTSPRAAVLIASSSALDELERLDGAARVPVEPLSESAARETFRAFAGREPSTTDEEHAEDEILVYCKGLPLAIELCAARLREEFESHDSVAASLRDEATRLSNMRTGSDSLSTILDASYRDLPADLARSYRLMGTSPALPNSLAAAACILGRPLEESKRQLRELRRRHLIRTTIDSPDGVSIDMHDLLRLHAASVSLRFGHPEEVEALADRLMHFVQAVGCIFDRTVSPERLRVALPPAPRWDDRWGSKPVPVTGGEADAIYARERQLILSVMRSSRPVIDDEAVCRVADSLWPVVYGRRFNNDTPQLYSIAAQAAGRIADPAVEARIALLHARGRYVAGDKGAAIKVSNRALDLASKTSDALLRAAAQGNKAYISYHCEGAEKALPLFKASKARYDPESTRGIAIQDYFIGRCLADLGELDDASEAMSEALDAFEQIGDEVLAVRCRSHLAQMIVTHDPVKAARLATRVISLAEDAGEYAPLARAHHVLAATESKERRVIHLRAARIAYEMVGDGERAAEIDRQLDAS